MPVTIKVNIDTAGTANTDGIVACKDNMAPGDSPLVAHLRNAGAVIVGRSNTPAFSLRWFTDNDLHGRTLNPFDAGVTPGGASGGAAAAVACAMTCSARRASATLRVSGPCTDISCAVMPRLGELGLYEAMRPAVVRRPTTPQAQAG